MTELFVTAPESTPKGRVLLAHGAGAPHDSPVMQSLAEKIAHNGLWVARFDFPYMLRRRGDGKKRPPDRAPVLLAAFEDAVAAVRDQTQGLSCPLVLGGKSMGGRMASMLAAEKPGIADGLLVFGYPFHPPGKPDRLRVDHFPALKCPMLIAQGSRDPFGTRAEVEAMTLPGPIKLHWAEDGNHDLKPRKATGFTHEDHLSAAAAQAAEFVLTLETG